MLESMITFIKILFLSKVLLLTVEPISISSSYVLPLKEELNVITKGAGLQIEISKLLKEKDSSRNYFRTGISDIILSKSITADMYYKNKKIITLELSSAIGFSKEKIFIYLKNLKEINLHMKFDKMVIKTQLNLKDISLTWANAST